MTKYPLATSTWDDKEIDAINTVIASDMYTMGKHVQQFEEEFSDFVGSKYSVMVNSGSSANLLAVAALFYTKNPKIKRGDEVIVPAMTYFATASTVSYQNAIPVFVDIEKETCNIDPEKIEGAITEKTTAILPVHVYGYPCDIRKINKIADKHNLKVIYDAAHAFAVKINGKSIFLQ